MNAREIWNANVMTTSRAMNEVREISEHNYGTMGRAMYEVREERERWGDR